MTLIPETVAAGRNAAAEDPRWIDIVARDRGADGKFWYSVATTGVYCRPSCPSRTANPGNVRFHASVAEARAAGFRPCRRCNPDGSSVEAANATLIAKACQMIDRADQAPSLAVLAADQAPSLAVLADAAGLSPAYFHRLFKRLTGLTPKEYAAARRTARAREALGTAGTVTEAIYDAGFNSSGRFYANSMAMFGMTPSSFRAGGAGEVLRFAIGQSALGAILVASSEKGVAAILIDADPEALIHDLQDRFPKARLVGGDTNYEKLVARVVGFVEAPRIGLDLPLDVRGTAFQQLVWQALRDIPAGQTATYAEIAGRIGAPKSVRAVAGACAANALAVAIPCHRVIRRDGALSGYRWGVERKHDLLAREAGA